MTKLLFETNICPFLPKLYGIYKSVEEIDFDALPQSFVLKTNHDCGGVVIVPDKEAFLGDSKKFGEAMAKLTKHLNTNFYTLYREYHYKDIEPRIFAEELLGERTQTPQHPSLDSKKIEKSDFHKSLPRNLSPNLPQNTTHNSPPFKVPDDYKFHCFGEEVFSETIIDRGIDTRCTFFDTQWEPLPVNITYDFAKRDILKPRYLDTMYAIAKLFYQDMGYLRCDFYVLRTQDFYIGELTLTPGGGCLPIRPREYDMILGSFWDTKAP